MNETESMLDRPEFVFRQVPAKVDAEDDGGSRRAADCFQGTLSGLRISELALWKNSRAKHASEIARVETRLEARDDEQAFADVGVQARRASTPPDTPP